MTEDVVQFITAQYNKLTGAEKAVAEYLITHFHAAIRMSVQELAQKAGVSAAAPVRLAQHMGFQGYKEFRLYLAQRQPEHDELILDMKQTTDSVSDTVEKVLSAEIETLRLTLRELDPTALQRVAEKTGKAQQLLFFGTGTSKIVCSDAAAKLRRVGKIAHCSDDIYEATTLMSTFSKDDLLVCVSHSGETESVCKAMKLGRDLGLYCVAVTTFENSSVCRDADCVLYTQTRESPLHKIALTSRISQLAVLDVLFMAYLAVDYDTCEGNLEKVSKNLKHMGLVP